MEEDEEHEPWEESLDVDDSDLPSLLRLRPCKRRHQTATTNHHRNPNTSPPSHHSILQPNFSETLLTPNSQLHSQAQLDPPPPPKPSRSPRLIPGPAGAVLSAMVLRNRNPLSDESPIPTTQEYIRRAVEDGEEDDDFKRNPWVFALQFLDRQGMVDGWPPSTPLSSIKKCLNIDRVDLVVAVIKSSTPNGFGDLMVALKDPTGSICANIHRKVIAEVEFGREISVGSVLILQKVAVFTPSRSAHYLNITPSNVVKIISKDSGPLLQQNYPVSAIKPTVLVNECSRELGNKQKTLPLEVCSSSTNRRDQNDMVEIEPLERQDAEKEIINSIGIETVDADQLGSKDANTLQNGGFSPSRLEHNSMEAKLIEKQNDQEINGGEKQRQQLISRASLPEWTDEQLNELFAADSLEEGSLF
ncbi:hypothetical protein CsSME_00054132 [Camellia sinensis var. sinensis]